MPRTNTPTDVFRSINTHNNDPTVCWEWLGTVGGRDGRGYMSIDSKKVMTHRVVWEIFHGVIPEGMIVRHKCDNPICNNPFHLELGTRGENEVDKYKRDRAGLPRDVVAEIRRFRNKMTQVSMQLHIMGKFRLSVSLSAIGKIWRGERRAGD